ncbi:MAG: class I SAM-dependent methyltransferase [Nitrospira sp.]|nr:class I SAM-dependent methyltransferase [Nitrospira sp.]
MLSSSDELRTALHEHLARWGLKRFTSDRDYFAWQRRQLSSADLNHLNRQVELKRSGDCRDEIAFYDLTAQPTILSVIHSQRYDYYEAVGLPVASRLGDARRVLDLGCGTGILTTFYAGRFPDKEFIAVDRSPASIAAARQKANELGLANVRFDCLDVERESLRGSFDLIVATHALMQAEQDPGIPSESWRTFKRAHHAERQTDFEQRTGIGARLDRLGAVLDSSGRMVVCEKVRHLARRVPFQRALAERDFQLIEPPGSIRYRLIEEAVDDGPLYVVQKGCGVALVWDESPETDEGLVFNRNAGVAAQTDPDRPLYENHWSSAQTAWEQLNHRVVTQEVTHQQSDGRQVHVELGISEDVRYLYCANTFDQRQLVIVEPVRAALLEAYYREIIGGMS